MTRTSIVLLVITAVGLSAVAPCQSPSMPDVGVKPYGSFAGGNVDRIDITNGNLNGLIPLISFQQRGKLNPLSFSYSLAANNAYQPVDTCDIDATETCYEYMSAPDVGGFTASFNPLSMLRSQQEYTYQYGNCDDEMCYTTLQSESARFYITDATGYTTNLESDISNPTTLRASDGSGHTLITTTGDLLSLWNGGSWSGTLYDPSGFTYETFYTDTNKTNNTSISNSAVADQNGNAITIQTLVGADPNYPSLNQYVDSINRVIPTPQLWPAVYSLYQGNPGVTTGCPNLGIQGQPAVGSVSWDPPGPNGGTSHYLFCLTPVVFHTEFFGVGDSNETPVWPYVQYYAQDPSQGNYPEYVNSIGFGYAIQAIVLPNNTFWGFVYDSPGCNGCNSNNFYDQYKTSGIPESYGSITEIRLPSGGTIDYTYGNMTRSNATYEFPTHHAIVARTVNDASGNSSTTSYVYGKYPTGSVEGSATPLTTVITTEKRDVSLNDSQHVNTNDVVHTFTDFTGTGNLYETQSQTYQGTSSSGALLETVSTLYQYGSGLTDLYYAPQHLPPVNVLPYSVTTSTPGGTLSEVTTSYIPEATVSRYLCGLNTNTGCNPYGSSDTISLNFPHEVTTTDGAGHVLQVETVTPEYQIDTTGKYVNTNQLMLVGSDEVDGPNGVNKETTYGYDNAGNRTATNSQVDATTTVSIGVVYTPQGMPYTVTDGNNNTTTYKYDGTGLYLAEIQRPTTSGTAHVDYYGYDANSGNLLYHTDENGSAAKDPNHTTTYTYNDPLGRLTKLVAPPVQAGVPETDVAYDDVARTVTTSVFASPDPTQTRSEAFDGLGRLWQVNGPSGATIETKYDALGRIASQSNPYFASKPAKTDGFTTYTYDAVGRPLYRCNPDNGTGAGSCEPGASYQQWTYSGNATTWTNEKRNSWQTTVDALGRLTGVTEPGGVNTTYAYDGIGNLLCVDQWNTGAVGNPCRSDHVRVFSYDLMSRLHSASNPESGNVCYGTMNAGRCIGGYDNNGNLLYKTDARGILITYAYDQLNRLQSKRYSNGTYSSCYLYDGSLSGSGLLSAEWTQVRACDTTQRSSILTQHSILSYDGTGHVTQDQRCVGSYCGTQQYRPMSYQYDIAGNLKSYGDGVGTRMFMLDYDTAGRLQYFREALPNVSSPVSLFSAQQFGSVGWSKAVIGTQMNSSRCFDNRLRVASEAVTLSSTTDFQCP